MFTESFTEKLFAEAAAVRGGVKGMMEAVMTTPGIDAWMPSEREGVLLDELGKVCGRGDVYSVVDGASGETLCVAGFAAGRH